MWFLENNYKNTIVFLEKLRSALLRSAARERLMYRKLVSAIYVINIASQAIFTLAMPIGVGVLLSYLLTEYAALPSWIWAVLVTLGAITGLYSMVKFVLSAMAGLERLENEHNTKEKQEKTGKKYESVQDTEK